MTTVVLDPGHGGTENLPGSNARNFPSVDNFFEKKSVLDLLFRVRGALEPFDVDVLMTRDADFNVSCPDRAELAINNQADLVVSLHHNAASPSARGFLFITSDRWGTRESLQATETMSQAFNNTIVPSLGVRDAGIRPDRQISGFEICLLREVNQANIPHVYIELLFMTNSSDLALLESESARREMALAMKDGIVNFLNLQLRPEFRDQPGFPGATPVVSPGQQPSSAGAGSFIFPLFLGAGAVGTFLFFRQQRQN